MDIDTAAGMVGDMTGDDTSETVGLKRRRSKAAKILPVVGYVGLGIVIGGSVALLFAPRKGEDLRKLIATRFSDLETKVKARLPSTTKDAAKRDDGHRKSNHGAMTEA